MVKNQVSNDVFFLSGAPQLGHLSAFLLISLPHSLHLVSAMGRSLWGHVQVR